MIILGSSSNNNYETFVQQFSVCHTEREKKKKLTIKSKKAYKNKNMA